MKSRDIDTKDDQAEAHFFSQLAASATVAEFKENISHIVKQLGFSDFCYVVLDAPPAKNLSTLPDQVHDFYLENDLAGHDFLLEHAAHSNAPIFLSTLKRYVANAPFSSERIYRNANCYELLASLGYHDCYSIPHSFGRASRRAMFSLFARGVEQEAFRYKVELNQSLLHMFVGAAAYFSSIHFPEYFLDAKYNGKLAITPKPLRLLQTVAKDGLLLKDAAKKLRISLDTANKHTAAVKQALGATTLAHAVYLAMERGLIQGENKDTKSMRF